MSNARPNPYLYLYESLVFVAVLTDGEGGAALTGLTLTAEVRDHSNTKVSTGTYTSTESPAGTYTTTIPYSALTALNLGQAYYPRYFCNGYEARGQKVAMYRPLT